MRLFTLTFFLFWSLSDTIAQESDSTKPNPLTTHPVARVLKLKGKVTMNGKPLSLGTIISERGLLETSEKSFVVLTIEKWNNGLTLGPSSKMNLQFDTDKKYVLESGLCRWKTTVKNLAKGNQLSQKGKLFTKNVSMGIRGTDFFISFNPIFGETEIVMFEGEVMMENADNIENKILVKSGEWGGLGGRFGKILNPPLTLPANVLENFTKTVEAP